MFDRCTFSYLHASSRGNVMDIMPANGRTTITNCHFLYNGDVSTETKGLIACVSLWGGDHSNVIMTNITSKHNVAAYGAGLVYTELCQLTIDRLVAHNNTAMYVPQSSTTERKTSMGGVFWLQLAPVRMSNLDIQYNTAWTGIYLRRTSHPLWCRSFPILFELA
jgi:hypothetical protein